MSLPTSEPILPENQENLPPARRRRQKRTVIPKGSGARNDFLQDLARRMVPSFDFFLFSLLCGVAIGIAMIFDAPSLYLLAVLLAPFMAPVTGLSLATVVGAPVFFLQSLGGVGVGGLLVFITGLISGWLSKFTETLTLEQAYFHTHFSWPDIILLSVGAALTIYLLIRSPKQRPLVASVALAYELYLPVGAAGFGFAVGARGLWPDGLIVFAVHLALAALIGSIMLAVLGLRPSNFFGYTVGSTLALAGVAALIVISGISTAVTTNIALPSATATHTLPPTLTPTTSTTPLPPTITPTPTNTLMPTRTPTQTLTPAPTPVYARINARGDDGAIIREEPGYNANYVIVMSNGMLVEVLPEIVEADGATWVHIRTSRELGNLEGWIVRSLLQTATPVPGW